MKRWIVVVTFGLLAITVIGPSFAQQVPGKGFSALLCLAEHAGSGPGNAQVSVTIQSDTGPNAEGTGQAVVTITHGTTGSTHTVIYVDTNGSGHLDCGDIIISVT